jgi:hypothetical protein
VDRLADTVAVNYLENGPRCWAVQCTNISDGTGETAVVKVDGTSAGPLGVNIAGMITYPTIHLKITEIEFQVVNMSLQILWNASVPLLAVALGPGARKLNFRRDGGLSIPSGLGGANGQILFTTYGQLVGALYTVILRGTKGIPKS